MAYTEDLAMGRTPGTKEYDSIVSSISSVPMKFLKKLLLLPLYLIGTALLVCLITSMFIIGTCSFKLGTTLIEIGELVQDCYWMWEDLLLHWD